MRRNKKSAGSGLLYPALVGAVAKKGKAIGLTREFAEKAGEQA